MTTAAGRWAIYQVWIDRYVAKHGGAVLGLCREAVQEMLVDHPELREVRGHVYCAWGRRGHAWLVDEAGDVVDPTRAQFPGPITYEPWKPGDTVLVGSCMDCGEEIWVAVQSLDEDPGHPTFCSEACEQATLRSLGQRF